MNYTKEEWAVKVNPKGYGYDVVEGKHRIADQLSEANANLIAAAPDMYKALREACQFITPQQAEFAPTAVSKIRQALAKAEGKE